MPICCEEIGPNDGGDWLTPQRFNDISKGTKGLPINWVGPIAKWLGIPEDYLCLLIGKLPPDIDFDHLEPTQVEEAMAILRRGR